MVRRETPSLPFRPRHAASNPPQETQSNANGETHTVPGEVRWEVDLLENVWPVALAESLCRKDQTQTCNPILNRRLDSGNNAPVSFGIILQGHIKACTAAPASGYATRSEIHGVNAAATAKTAMLRHHNSVRGPAAAERASDQHMLWH